MDSWPLAGEDEQLEFNGHQSQPVMQAPHGRWLSVCRLADGAKQWSREERGQIDERMIAVRKGRIYYHVAQVGTFCRRLPGGEQVWADTDAETVAAIDAGRDKIKDNDLSLKGMQISQASPIAQDEALIICALRYDNAVALDPDSGKLLWKLPHRGFIRGRGTPQLSMQGKWYTVSGVYDMRTGKLLDKLKLPQSGCGSATAAADYFISDFGGLFEIATGNLVPTHGRQRALRPGQHRGRRPGGEPRVDVRLSHALERVPAFTSVPDLSRQISRQKADRRQMAAQAPAAAAFAVDNQDWPTCRHDNGRSGATAVSVSLTGAIACSALEVANRGQGRPALGNLGVLMHSVAAAGKAWSAGPTASSANWTPPPGDWSGNIRPAPNCSPRPWRPADGSTRGPAAAMCSAWSRLRKAALAFPRRAGPVDRRILWYGQLLGTWPLVGGVTLHDGTVYAIAGYQNLNGTHAYAGLADGSLKWDTHDAGNGPGDWGGAGSLWRDRYRRRPFMVVRPGQRPRSACGTVFLCFSCHVGLRQPFRGAVDGSR